MHSDTGKLYNGTEEELSALEKTLGDKLKRLGEQEYEHLKKIDPPTLRPEELALMRFIEERKRLKAPHNVAIQNAFRLGFRAGRES
ncbi:MAG: hypothetical protein OIN85_00710 [Candidatus Methanoperedens sp.]|nr:hypothetical protein [Candidatus Methanoperedens sp.]